MDEMVGWDWDYAHFIKSRKISFYRENSLYIYYSLKDLLIDSYLQNKIRENPNVKLICFIRDIKTDV